MKLAVFYEHVEKAAAQRGISMSEALACVRQMGYSMIEIDFDALTEEAYALIAGAGLEISSVYCFFRFDREPQRERIHALVESALRFGAKRVMPIPGFFRGETDEARRVELNRMLASMKELTDLAGQHGLTVTIEDFDSADSPIRNSRGMNVFLERLPSLRATFDTGNFRYSMEDEFSAFEALKASIAHVHLKDRSRMNGSGDSSLTAMDGAALYPCPVGSGFIPIRELLVRLAGIGYDGVLVCEHFGTRDQLACMEQSAQFVRSITKTA